MRNPLSLVENNGHGDHEMTVMHVLIICCCLCGKVWDDEGDERGRGIWIELETYRSRHNLTEEPWFLHTYCSYCATRHRQFVTAKEMLKRSPAAS